MIKKLFPILILTVLVLSICISNFTPDTYLTGWDNLHPEFNFALNLKRSIFSVWQEYQGLGLLAGMGHAADLPRQIILAVSSIIIPQNLLRYLYHFSMLLAGVLGIYALSKEFILKNSNGLIKEIGSLFSAIFYILNLGTIQYFFVPFEPYSTFWGMFPWEIYSLLKYLKSPTNKNLLFLSIINLIAVPQGYVQTIFLVYITILFIFLIAHLLKEKNKTALKTSVKVAIVVLVINAFWLLPSLYFIKTSFSVNRNAVQNIMATEKFFLMNKKRGNIKDFIQLKEFYYDYMSFNFDKQNNGLMMAPWINQFSKKSVDILTAGLFLIILLGLFKKNKYSPELLAIFAISGLLFLSNTPFVSQINDFLRQNPLFEQLFRNPFTKFIVPTIFVFSLFFGIGTVRILSFVKKDFLIGAGTTTLLLIFIYIFAPVWTGNLIYKFERINIPKGYFEVFEYFKNDPDKGRIANFPQSNIWGWTYYHWGFVGSGFIWYGIEQPILDQAFSVWSAQNENSYWELSYAVYSDNQNQFENVLEKYQVKYVLIDKNIFSYTPYKALNYESIEKLLDKSKKAVEKKEFGKIIIYKIKLDTNEKGFLFAASGLTSVGPKYNWGNFDQVYSKNSNYITYESNDENKYYYPFRSIFTGKEYEKSFEIIDYGDSFSISTKIPEELLSRKLVVPEINKEDITEYNSYDLSKTETKYPIVKLDKDGKLEVNVPKIKGYNSYDSKTAGDFQNIKPTNCDQFNNGPMKTDVLSNELIELTSKDSDNCVYFDLKYLPHKYGYLISIDSKNISGKSLQLLTINQNSKKFDLEINLPKNKTQSTNYFILPPMEQDGLGYTLHFDNISYGDVISRNQLGQITVNQIPYNFLTNIKLVKDEGEIQPETYAINSTHPNPSLYEININELKVGESTIVLSQSFNNGWKAYKVNKNISSIFAPLFGEKIKDHVLINNWENGWKVEKGLLEKDQKIVITFLPQYLQYLGFALLALLIPLYRTS